MGDGDDLKEKFRQVAEQERGRKQREEEWAEREALHGGPMTEREHQQAFRGCWNYVAVIVLLVLLAVVFM